MRTQDTNPFCVYAGINKIHLLGNRGCRRNGGDDHQALIWDIQQMPRTIEDSIRAYTADGEINQIQWAAAQANWISICYNNCVACIDRKKRGSQKHWSLNAWSRTPLGLKEDGWLMKDCIFSL